MPALIEMWTSRSSSPFSIGREVVGPRSADLPAPIRRYVERAITADTPIPRRVRITQRGEMWSKPGGRAMRFTATQLLDVDRIAFSWQARFPLLGPIALHVVDAYADGVGTLEVRLFGFSLQRQQGRETTAGEALRYLAELPFVPYAIAHNRELQWREVGERSAEVAACVHGERLTVRHELDADGDIAWSSSPLRPRKVGNEWVPTSWGGRFADYRTLGGIRLPTSAEAFWDLPEGRYVYWRGTVLSASV